MQHSIAGANRFSTDLPNMSSKLNLSVAVKKERRLPLTGCMRFAADSSFDFIHSAVRLRFARCSISRGETRPRCRIGLWLRIAGKAI